MEPNPTITILVGFIYVAFFCLDHSESMFRRLCFVSMERRRLFTVTGSLMVVIECMSAYESFAKLIEGPIHFMISCHKITNCNSAKSVGSSKTINIFLSLQIEVWHQVSIIYFFVPIIVSLPLARSFFQGRIRGIPDSIPRGNNTWPVRMPLRMSRISLPPLVGWKPVRKYSRSEAESEALLETCRNPGAAKKNLSKNSSRKRTNQKQNQLLQRWKKTASETVLQLQTKMLR
ncbi:transmembrane protein, putative [Medicago truncatula]|uniref:Transmembrane protein, putative n=1 Tax=Medicago truncatula TaxID=3880 RepID=G7J8M1_MEDTR|nr:transmembrane protein, putative [Medicago truncatula]